MAYCTQADIEQHLTERELAELTDDVAGDTTDVSLVDDAIEVADGLCDSFIAKQYAVPLSPVPALVRAISRDVAIFGLYQRREVMPERRQKAYDNALKLLGQIAKGEVTLGVEPSPGASSAALAQRGGPDQVFTRESLEDF